MYQNPQRYPFLEILESNWQAILAEYRGVAENPEMHQWPEKQLFDGRWDTFGLYAFGVKQHDNCQRCPVTTRLVEQIPGMVMAGFSRLAGGTHIKPHVGYGGWSQYVMRCHLGLIVPQGCEMRVGQETRSWQNGKVTVFCDATEHEVWNRAATDRVVLLLDFRNPDFKWRFLNPEITPEMQQFIRDRWGKLTLKEKIGFVAWRGLNFWRKPRRYVDDVNANAAGTAGSPHRT